MSVPTFASSKRTSARGYSTKFIAGTEHPYRLAFIENGEPLFVDLTPFGDRAEMVCGYLLRPSKKMHTVFGQLEGSVLQTLPSFLTSPTSDWLGSATINFENKQSLLLYSKSTAADEWTSRMGRDDMGRVYFEQNSNFYLTGPVVPEMQPTSKLCLHSKVALGKSRTP